MQYIFLEAYKTIHLFTPPNIIFISSNTHIMSSYNWTRHKTEWVSGKISVNAWHILFTIANPFTSSNDSQSFGFYTSVLLSYNVGTVHYWFYSDITEEGKSHFEIVKYSAINPVHLTLTGRAIKEARHCNTKNVSWKEPLVEVKIRFQITFCHAVPWHLTIP